MFRIILISVLALLISVNAVQAQTALNTKEKTPLSNAMINAYFDKCMVDGYPVENDDDLMGWCACTSANLKTFISKEEWDYKNENNKRGNEVIRKVFIHVYGSCLAFPVKFAVKDYCVRTKEAKIFGPDAASVYELCNCITRKMVSFANLYGPDLMYEKVAKQTIVHDPVSVFMTSWQYYREYTQYRNRCILDINDKKKNKSFGPLDFIEPLRTK